MKSVILLCTWWHSVITVWCQICICLGSSPVQLPARTLLCEILIKLPLSQSRWNLGGKQMHYVTYFLLVLGLAVSAGV